jgi:hypothetical protein
MSVDTAARAVVPLIERRLAVSRELAKGRKGLSVYRLSDLPEATPEQQARMDAIQCEAQQIAHALPDEPAMHAVYDRVLAQHGHRHAGKLERLWEGVRGWLP